MSAGAGTDQYAEALKLEKLLVAAFGPDFREKMLVMPLGVWPLRDAFDECGLKDPRAPAPSSGAYGLWQAMPATHMLAGAERPLATASPADQARWMASYMAERYPLHEMARALRTEQYRRFASPSAVADRMGIEAEARRIRRKYTRWPVSPAPRSPHGDPLR